MVGEVAKDKDTTGFGDRLKALRIASGMTQQELADKLGLPAQNVTRLEKGHRTPTWATVLKIAAALGAEPNDFLPQGE